MRKVSQLPKCVPYDRKHGCLVVTNFHLKTMIDDTDKNYCTIIAHLVVSTPHARTEACPTRLLGTWPQLTWILFPPMLGDITSSGHPNLVAKGLNIIQQLFQTRRKLCMSYSALM